MNSSVTNFEIIDAPELTHRLSVPVSWVREYVRRRAGDPIPHLRFGRYPRFAWGSPELDAWLERRKVNGRVR